MPRYFIVTTKTPPPQSVSEADYRNDGRNKKAIKTDGNKTWLVVGRVINLDRSLHSIRERNKRERNSHITRKSHESWKNKTWFSTAALPKWMLGFIARHEGTAVYAKKYPDSTSFDPLAAPRRAAFRCLPREPRCRERALFRRHPGGRV